MLRKLDGSTAMMPAMMISEAPLPTPYSVISSPIHMTRIAPAIRDEITMKPSRIERPCMLVATIFVGLLYDLPLGGVVVGLMIGAMATLVAGLLAFFLEALLARTDLPPEVRD